MSDALQLQRIKTFHHYTLTVCVRVCVCVCVCVCLGGDDLRRPRSAHPAYLGWSTVDTMVRGEVETCIRVSETTRE